MTSIKDPFARELSETMDQCINKPDKSYSILKKYFKDYFDKNMTNSDKNGLHNYVSNLFVWYLGNKEKYLNSEAFETFVNLLFEVSGYRKYRAITLIERGYRVLEPLTAFEKDDEKIAKIVDRFLTVITEQSSQKDVYNKAYNELIETLRDYLTDKNKKPYPIDKDKLQCFLQQYIALNECTQKQSFRSKNISSCISDSAQLVFTDHGADFQSLLKEDNKQNM